MSDNRHGFSSFKPTQHAEDVASTDILTENAITSEQLQARLHSLSLDVAVAQFEDGQEEIVTSPLPVSDLAADARKKKRRSWLSNDGDKKSKSFLRFFSPNRSYSLHKKRESKTTTKKWKIGSFFKSSPERRLRFFSFKSLSGRKRGHTLNTSANESTSVNDVYSVFDDVPEPLGLQRSSSVDNVTLKPRNKVPGNRRPVSFMTFQQFPLDFNSFFFSEFKNFRSMRFCFIIYRPS
uniref:Uncharacterized protein n=1 Tax=Ciona savignyi TaxID=51511 RepID=H2ZIT0_CIOSA